MRAKSGIWALNGLRKWHGQMIRGGEKQTGQVRSGAPALQTSDVTEVKFPCEEPSQTPHEATGTETPFSVRVVSF
jgi:hypothetical protein